MATRADGQLCLDVSADALASATADIDIVDAVLAANQGDGRLAIQELLADADFLRDQLYTASCLMSRGMAYGWRPKYERV